MLQKDKRMLTRQEKAVIKEFWEAVEDGRIKLAKAIAKANPDLFPWEGYLG